MTAILINIVRLYGLTATQQDCKVMWVAFNPSKTAHNFTVVSAIEAWYETSQELIFDVFLIVELCRGWKFLNETSHNALGSCRLGSPTMLM